ncbi:MAG: DNA-processing protein DprA [Rhodothermales bacterium]
MNASPRALLAHALERLDGVGRVSAGRLVRHFESYHALTSYPREQVLTRLKSAPNANRLVDHLFDPQFMEPVLEAAEAELRGLEQSGIQAIAFGDAGWPADFSRLPASDQPNLLYLYGHRRVLEQPLAALFGKAALREEAFDYAQTLVRFLSGRNIHPVIGAAHGFDVVMAKLSVDAATPALMLCASGLAHIAPPLRPTVSATVRAGGALLTSFPMQQPHFPHQDDDQALHMAAIAQAGIFLDPDPGEPAWKAMEWMLENHKAVFAVGNGPHPLPERIHLLETEIDQEWVATAVTEGRR